jgi:ornithine carbamoyltransferase
MMYARNLAKAPEVNAPVKHFLDISDIPVHELRNILDFAIRTKKDFKQGKATKYLEGKHIALVFEKPSTRTRASFEVAMNQLGGYTIMMDTQSSQLGRGETVADTARVLSRYVSAIMLRCFQHEMLKEMAEYAKVPVINGLTDSSHPCQVMADIMTFIEHKGPIEDKVVTWIGDTNNMARSWMHAANSFGFELRISCPEELNPPASQSKHIKIITDPQEAVKGSDLITTDTWVSMGDVDGDFKRNILKPYQVNDELMRHAKSEALFMHCLPAHRGEEVTDGVIDGAQSVVWDEAENRLHIQKAILVWCMAGLPAASKK